MNHKKALLSLLRDCILVFFFIGYLYISIGVQLLCLYSSLCIYFLCFFTIYVDKCTCHTRKGIWCCNFMHYWSLSNLQTSRPDCSLTDGPQSITHGKQEKVPFLIITISHKENRLVLLFLRNIVCGKPPPDIPTFTYYRH